MFNMFIGAVLIMHILFAWRTQIVINQSSALSSSQKRLNSILNWLLPFLWSFIARSIIKPTDKPVATKAGRKTSSGKNTDNWENLTGYGGGSGISN